MNEDTIVTSNGSTRIYTNHIGVVVFDDDDETDFCQSARSPFPQEQQNKMRQRMTNCDVVADLEHEHDYPSNNNNNERNTAIPSSPTNRIGSPTKEIRTAKTILTMTDPPVRPAISPPASCIISLDKILSNPPMAPPRKQRRRQEQKQQQQHWTLWGPLDDEDDETTQNIDNRRNADYYGSGAFLREHCCRSSSSLISYNESFPRRRLFHDGDGKSGLDNI